MAVAINATSTHIETSQVTSTGTWNHTVGAGSNFLILAFALHDTTSKPTSLVVKWNTTETMTVDPVLTGIQDSANNHQWLWCYYLANPTTGAHAFTLTWTNAARMTGFAMDFSGAGSIGTSTYNNTSGPSTSHAVTSSSVTANDMVIAAAIFTDYSVTVSWDSTELSAEISDSNQQTESCAYKTGSGALAQTATTSGSCHRVVGAICVIATAAAGPANMKSYNTNLKANIKSINTNLIANVKSFDTNA